MAILSKVGRRSPGARTVISVFYTIIIIGAVTMVYPFLLMLASSITGPQDMMEFRLIPRFLYRDDALYLRVITEKYLGADYLADHYGIGTDIIPMFEVDELGDIYRSLGDDVGWNPATASSGRLRQLADFEEFLASVVPSELLQVGFEQEFGIPRRAEREYWDFIRDAHQNNLADLNHKYGENWDDFLLVPMPKERVAYRSWVPPQSARYQEYLTFKSFIRKNQPMLLESQNGDIPWRRHVQNTYDNSIDRLNQAWGRQFKSFDDLYLPLTNPANTTEASVWEDFVRRKWSPRHIAWGGDTQAKWQTSLRSSYTARARANGALDIDQQAMRLLRAAHGQDYASWDAIPLPTASQLVGTTSADFYAFVRGEGDAKPFRPDVSSARLITCAGTYRDFLLRQFGGLSAINDAYGTKYDALESIRPPFAMYDWWKVKTQSGTWRWYFISNNFRLVLDRILFRGDALVNTGAFVVLALAIQLTVNPACAFALSRFRLRYIQKILLLLIATMAFPAEVTMIPGFLLLRDLGMLNTFAALLLPGAANGFMIFILKGFFDSLPREMYEAAQIDGAGEWRIFAQITLPLSKPVLAFVALGSFMAVYTTFLFAMVICQDSRMWTLMVWIYQLQGTVHPSAQMAALLVVMLPTLIVLAMCQRVIMRGIVLPQMQ